MNQSLNLSKIRFHQGEALIRIAGHYSTIPEVIFEAVQNALDANARNIRININYQNNVLSICDDGDGTTQEMFEKALQSICHSIKDSEKLGQFGMGMIAGLGKCEKFTFTSSHKKSPYLQWTFDTNKIKKQEEVSGIPVVQMPNMVFDRDANLPGSVPWRTQIRLFNFVKDKILNKTTTAGLKEGILEKFSPKMIAENTHVFVEIIPEHGNTERIDFFAEKYKGQKIPSVSYSNKHAGVVNFELFLANKCAQGRSGKVVVGVQGKDFRFSFSLFCKSAREYLENETIQGLNSGIFEGEITATKTRLHPNRKQLEENEALIGFCSVLDKWYKEIGSEFVNKANEESENERYQKLGEKSMKVLEAMFKKFKTFRDVINSFKIGSKIGNGLVMEGPLSGGGNVENKSDNAGEGTRKSEGKNLVDGPNGRNRASAEGKNLGLKFLYDEMEGSEKLWFLEERKGLLHFNTRHPHWSECEKDDKALMRLQEYVAINALFIQSLPVEWRDNQRISFDEFMEFYVFWLISGDSISGRNLGRPKIN